MGTIMMTLVSAASYTSLDYVFFLLNLAIIAGYATIAVTCLFPTRILPVLSLAFRKRSRLATAGFFIIAGVTRAQLAWNTVDSNRAAQCPNELFPSSTVRCLFDVTTTIVTLHIFQAIFVWLMLIFLGADLFKNFRFDEDEE